MACFKCFHEKLQVVKGRQGRALESSWDKWQDIDFQHRQCLGRSCHGPCDSHCCYVSLRGAEKMHISITYFSTFFLVKSWAATSFIESMSFTVLGWLHGSSTFEEVQCNIHVFKGKYEYGHCSFWEILEINHKGPQEKSMLGKLEKMYCTGRVTNVSYPSVCLLFICNSQFPIDNWVNFC